MRGGIYEANGEYYFGDGTPVHIYNDYTSPSQAIYEQAEDDAFQKRFTADCEHIWEREDYRVWVCLACYDTADFSEGWE